MSDLTQDIAGVIYRTECNWDRETSGPGSRFEGETRDHAQARGVLNHLRSLGLLAAAVGGDLTQPDVNEPGPDSTLAAGTSIQGGQPEASASEIARLQLKMAINDAARRAADGSPKRDLLEGYVEQEPDSDEVGGDLPTVDDDLLREIRTRISDPGQFLPRGALNHMYTEEITAWSARAVEELVRARLLALTDDTETQLEAAIRRMRAAESRANEQIRLQALAEVKIEQLREEVERLRGLVVEREAQLRYATDRRPTENDTATCKCAAAQRDTGELCGDQPVVAHGFCDWCNSHCLTWSTRRSPRDRGYISSAEEMRIPVVPSGPAPGASSGVLPEQPDQEQQR